MPEDSILKAVHNPVRSGTVPTPDGIFPVSPNGGGLRRRRKPMIDLSMHDASAKIADQGDLLESAWGILANAHGGNWDLASTEWRAAAEAWRDRYFARQQAGPTDATESAQEAERPAPQVAQVQPSAANEDRPELLVMEDKDLDAFLARLSMVTVEDAKTEIPAWDGQDDSFLAAATARWNELHPATQTSTTGEPGANSGEPGLSRDALMEDDEDDQGGDAEQPSGEGQTGQDGAPQGSPAAGDVPPPPAPRKRGANKPEK